MQDEALKPGPEDYGPDYYGKVPGLARLSPFGIHWWSVRFYAKIVDRLLKRSDGSRILEVGCAHGHLLSWLEGSYQTWGIDLSDYAIEQARSNAPKSRVFRANLLEALPDELDRQRYDLVVSKYVLEHIDRPAVALGEIYQRLVPGGWLLYSVPNMTSPGLKLKGDQWFAALDPTHVSMLQPEEWARLTRDAGFVIEKTFSDGMWDIPYVRYVPRVFQYLMFSLPTIASVGLARPLIPVRWGENLIVIARKPQARTT